MDFFISQVGLILIAMDGAISMVDDFLLNSDSLTAGKLFRIYFFFFFSRYPTMFKSLTMLTE